jgi:hypothetical protein
LIIDDFFVPFVALALIIDYFISVHQRSSAALGLIMDD